MSGVKHRSGGRRAGAGAKKQADLRGLHELIDARIDEKDWDSIIAALVKKARRGDVQAFRELRACRFGQIPVASVRDPDEEEPLRINTVTMVLADTGEEEEEEDSPVLANGVAENDPALPSAEESARGRASPHYFRT